MVCGSGHSYVKIMSSYWNRMLWRSDRCRNENRAARRRKGLLRYHFDNHILILGGGEMVVELLDAIAARQDWMGKNVVALSSQDAGQVRDRLATRLSPEARELAITVYHGVRTSEAELFSCHVEQASHIFIVGEDGEDGHDALNVECWTKVRILRMQSPQVAQCYLFVDKSTTIELFHKLPQEAHTSVETTIVDRGGAMVQQLLMGDSPQALSKTLDRGLITGGSDRYVHLVVVGMTEVGYTFATTAAQLCHFPNFDETSSRPLRTRITFIDPTANVKMQQFKSMYPTLFELSHSRYKADEISWLQGRPDGQYGDFLDVEWEFVEGSVDEEWVRDMLSRCAEDAQQVLSVAFCQDSADENYRQSIHLPSQLYCSIDPEKSICPNIYVYQPQSSTLLRAAQAEVMYLGNLIPFGERGGGYDPLLVRQTAAAKRVNFLYQKETSGRQFVSMPTDAALLDSMWQQLSLSEKMSDLCSATALYAELRSLGMEANNGCQPLDNPEMVEALSRIEHARWNMEKLLAGFVPMPATSRDGLNAALQSDDPDVQQETHTLANRLANQHYRLKDITPYASLPEASKADIRTIARNLPLAALPYISSVENDLTGQ